MKDRRLLWLLLLGVAAWLALFGDKTPPDSGEVVAPTPNRMQDRPDAARRSATRPAAARHDGQAAQSDLAQSDLEVLPLLARDQLIPAVAKDHQGRDLFAAVDWTPAPPPPPPPARKPAKLPPPTAPPLPFVYLGKKLEAGQWEAYLGRGEELFIARQGVTLAGQYQVQSIGPTTLTLIYLPLKQPQTISIGGAP